MRPNGFDALAVGHPDASHEGKIVFEVTGFTVTDQVKLWDRETKGFERDRKSVV